MNNTRTKTMVETAVMLALAIVLSFLHLPSLPYGGHITLCSALPVILVAYRHGMKWGVFAGFVYSLLNILLHLSELRGYTWAILAGCLLFDYILAGTVLGLGGLFHSRMQNPSAALICGTLLALFMKYMVHVISGFIFFREYAVSVLSQEGFLFGKEILGNTSGNLLYFLYSLVYNGLHMIPEMILSAIVAGVVGAVPVFAKRQRLSHEKA